MKTRNGFVSNSSSSSFIINKKDLTKSQINDIKNHKKILEANDSLDFEWTIEESLFTIKGSVFMDNIDMESFLSSINVDMSKVKWSD